jgi:hypothetical protein
MLRAALDGRSIRFPQAELRTNEARRPRARRAARTMATSVRSHYRAANIRAGCVYVISNIGSFGEQMVKIGMTCRLDPLDRIRELSDASVPFKFDVHAVFLEGCRGHRTGDARAAGLIARQYRQPMGSSSAPRRSRSRLTCLS